MVKEIELQNGLKVLVDDEDFERVNEFYWNIARSGSIKNKNNLTLSRFITNIKKQDKCLVFHKNGDKFDFTRGNLLVGDSSRKQRYMRGQKESSSKYKGVNWDKKSHKWRASITIKGKTKYLGLYGSEDGAARAYNKAVLDYYDGDGLMNVLGNDNNNTGGLKFENVRQQRSKSKSGFRGCVEVNNKYQAQIFISEKIEYLGIFETPEEAARAYDQKAKELFGDKAILNFPDEQG